MNDRRARLLLVEDDDAHAELVQLALEDTRASTAVTRLSDGAAALAYLRREPPHENRPRPDLVLLDLKLPKIDGLEVLQKIKADERLRHIPVVILTTSHAEVDRAAAYAHHANSYLVKPADCDSFHRMMLSAWDYWSKWNTPPATHRPRRRFVLRRD
jgi:CheY-like chemotaxis protein